MTRACPAGNLSVKCLMYQVTVTLALIALFSLGIQLNPSSSSSASFTNACDRRLLDYRKPQKMARISSLNRLRYLRMDDERSRESSKDDLTLRDEYLDNRFYKLSKSGHDLTVMTEEEIDKSKAERIQMCREANEESPFLGYGRKGVYVSMLGGLPLFSSGCIIKDSSSRSVLYFDEPCDEDHVIVQQGKLLCARSRQDIGHVVYDDTPDSSRYDAVKYAVFADRVSFLDIIEPWPIESQPENYWGTEGQYCAWNSNKRLDSPLSY